jgi:serine/threonine protein kinase
MLLRHPSITYIYDAFEFRDTFYIIVERCLTTLDEIIHHKERIGEEVLLPVARCVLQGLSFMHQNNYVHKDLHSENVFAFATKSELGNVDKDIAFSFKIGDLGISRLDHQIDAVNTVLANWMLPPEFLDPHRNGDLGKITDIYHFGLLLLYLLTNQVFDFTEKEIKDGAPREIAESLHSPYAKPISYALRRRTQHRIQSPLLLWQELLNAKP